MKPLEHFVKKQYYTSNKAIKKNNFKNIFQSVCTVGVLKETRHTPIAVHHYVPINCRYW